MGAIAALYFARGGNKSYEDSMSRFNHRRNPPSRVILAIVRCWATPTGGPRERYDSE